MALLSLIQNAADRLGIVRPATVVTSTDQQALRLLGFAQQEGKALARRHTWQVLTFVGSFTATATQRQANALPTTFDRLIDNTFYNATRRRPVYGPMNPQEWQFASNVVSSVVIESFRMRGATNDILLLPTPTAGDSYRYEYISKNWCQSAAGTGQSDSSGPIDQESAGGTGQSAWALDTDTGILEEELMTLGVEWRFKAAQGLDYAEEFRNYELMVGQAVARDGGKRTLDVGYYTGNRGPNAPFVQDGSWNL